MEKEESMVPKPEVSDVNTEQTPVSCYGVMHATLIYIQSISSINIFHQFSNPTSTQLIFLCSPPCLPNLTHIRLLLSPHSTPNLFYTVLLSISCSFIITSSLSEFRFFYIYFILLKFSILLQNISLLFN